MTTIDDTEAKQAMLNALAGYTGPITHCPDGEATAEPLKMVDDAAPLAERTPARSTLR